MAISYQRLFNLLNKRGLTATYWLRQHGIHAATVNKLRKNERINTDTIEKLCSLLNCQPGDLMEHITGNGLVESLADDDAIHSISPDSPLAPCFRTGHYETYSQIQGERLLTSHDRMMKSLEADINERFVDEGDPKGYEAPSPYCDASIFLQGSCQLFSLALHQRYGFHAYEISLGKDFHYFCTSSCNGVVVYIDVRGAISDFNEFIVTSALPKADYDSYDFIPQDFISDAELSGEWDKEGLDFAKQLIIDHPERYRIGTP